MSLKREDKFIISEGEEVGPPLALGWAKRLRVTFPAFEERNFRLYFGGQFISLIGSWLQVVAQGWLVLELTHSAFWVGVVAALSSVPILIFALASGVIVDRFPKKKILIITQALAMLCAFFLGLFTVLHMATILMICIFAFLLGVVNALDIPARQAFIPEMMGKKHVASAISLHAAIFNGSRVLGPAFAGILIGLIGLGGTFFLNAVSFIAVIVSLFLMRVDDHVAPHHLHPVAAIREGLHYAFSRAPIRMLLIVASVVSIFGWSYASILPVVAEEVFHQDATGLGYLFTATGLGALLSVLLISVYAHRIGSHKFILGGNLLLGVSLLLFSFTHRFDAGLFLMFCTGLALTSQFSVVNSTIQHIVDDSVRGRVMSIYVLMFRGTAPIGALLMGYVAQHFGSQLAIRWGSLVVLAIAAVLFMKSDTIPSLKKKDWQTA